MATGIVTPIGIVGISLGGIVPPLLITYGVPSTFIIQAGVVSIISLIMLILGIPGWRDDPDSVEKYLEKYEKEKEEESFFKSMINTFHQRSWVLLLIIYLTWQVLTFCVQASVPYLMRFVLKMEASAQLFLQVGFLIGAVISIPIWVKLANKINDNKKVYVIAGVILVIFSIPLSLIANYFILIILFILWGVGLGGFWALNRIILSDVVDEAVVNTGKREEGIYSGIFMFFNRLAIIIQVVIFAIVHTMTGFVEGADSQSAQAQWGIQLHIGIIPAIVLLVGTLLFWKFYDLTPTRIEDVQSRLKDMGL
jgi:GPH family glycoside/pentoside/hexuronide:cation symporter